MKDPSVRDVVHLIEETKTCGYSRDVEKASVWHAVMTHQTGFGPRVRRFVSARS